MTKLEDALGAVGRTVKGPPCSLGNLLAHLPVEERKALEVLVDPDHFPRTPGSALSRAISSAYGIDVHRSTIDRHRRGDCVCRRVGR